MPSGFPGMFGGLRSAYDSGLLSGNGLFPYPGGKIIYLDPVNGSDQLDGSAPDRAKGTLDGAAGAFSLATAGKNDIIVLMSDAAASTSFLPVNAAFSWNKRATHLIGLSSGGRFGNKCKIAPALATTAFANFFTISAAGCRFENIMFYHDFTTDTTNQICVTISAANTVFKNCQIVGSSQITDAGNRALLLAAGADFAYFEDCVIGSTDFIRGNSASALMEFTTGACKNPYFNRCEFISRGNSATPVMWKIGAAGIAGLLIFRECIWHNQGTALTSSGAIDGAPGGFILHYGSVLMNVGTYGDTTSTRVPGFTSATNFQLMVAPAA